MGYIKLDISIAGIYILFTKIKLSDKTNINKIINSIEQVIKKSKNVSEKCCKPNSCVNGNSGQRVLIKGIILMFNLNNFCTELENAKSEYENVLFIRSVGNKSDATASSNNYLNLIKRISSNLEISKIPFTVLDIC